MARKNLRLGKYWKLFWATLTVQSKSNSQLKRVPAFSTYQVQRLDSWCQVTWNIQYNIQNGRKHLSHRYYIKRHFYCHVKMQLQKAVHYDWILWSSHHFYLFGRLERNEEHVRYKKSGSWAITSSINFASSSTTLRTEWKGQRLSANNFC